MGIGIVVEFDFMILTRNRRIRMVILLVGVVQYKVVVRVDMGWKRRSRRKRK